MGTDEKNPPVFGFNGAVLNSPVLSDEGRRQYDDDVRINEEIDTWQQMARWLILPAAILLGLAIVILLLTSGNS